MTLERAHFTTDTCRLAPYPGMTEDDLRDFESWADEVDRNQPPLWPMLALLLFWAAVLWVA